MRPSANWERELLCVHRNRIFFFFTGFLLVGCEALIHREDGQNSERSDGHVGGDWNVLCGTE